MTFRVVQEPEYKNHLFIFRQVNDIDENYQRYKSPFPSNSGGR